MKWEAKKEPLYKPSSKLPQIVNVPSMLFAAVSGSSDPNTSREFAQAIESLYSVSYAIKMMPRKGTVPEGYYEYTVPPLEGFWDLENTEAFDPKHKENLAWTIMIRQPIFVDDELFETAKDSAQKKKPENGTVSQLSLKTVIEGLCCQFLHVGPFDDEPVSFSRMEDFITREGYSRPEHSHHEIYLSDFRKTAPEKLKKILRFRITDRK